MAPSANLGLVTWYKLFVVILLVCLNIFLYLKFEYKKKDLNKDLALKSSLLNNKIVRNSWTSILAFSTLYSAYVGMKQEDRAANEELKKKEAIYLKYKEGLETKEKLLEEKLKLQIDNLHIKEFCKVMNQSHENCTKYYGLIKERKTIDTVTQALLDSEINFASSVKEQFKKDYPEYKEVLENISLDIDTVPATELFESSVVEKKSFVLYGLWDKF